MNQAEVSLYTGYTGQEKFHEHTFCLLGKGALQNYKSIIAEYKLVFNLSMNKTY